MDAVLVATIDGNSVALLYYHQTFRYLFQVLSLSVSRKLRCPITNNTQAYFLLIAIVFHIFLPGKNSLQVDHLKLVFNDLSECGFQSSFLLLMPTNIQRILSFVVLTNLMESVITLKKTLIQG